MTTTATSARTDVTTAGHQAQAANGLAIVRVTGLAAANSPDVVVFLDGDYSDRPSELPTLLAPIIEGRADIAIGSRLHKRRSDGALPWHQAFGNRLAASSCGDPGCPVS